MKQIVAEQADVLRIYLDRRVNEGSSFLNLDHEFLSASISKGGASFVKLKVNLYARLLASSHTASVVRICNVSLHVTQPSSEIRADRDALVKGSPLCFEKAKTLDERQQFSEHCSHISLLFLINKIT